MAIVNPLSQDTKTKTNITQTTSASGNFVVSDTEASTCTMILNFKVTGLSGNEGYIIPYYSISLGKWCGRLKSTSDTTLTSTSVTYDITYIP